MDDKKGLEFGPDGKIIKSKGRPFGAKDKVPRRSILARENKRAALLAMQEAMLQAGQHMPDVIGVLVEAAKQDPAHAANFVKLFGLPPPKAPMDDAEDLANLPPDQRIVEANRLMAAGLIDTAAAQAIAIGARQELENGFLRVCRSALADMTGGRIDSDGFVAVIVGWLMTHDKSEGDGNEQS